MKDWDDIYKEKGAFQEDVRKVPREAIGFFRKEGLKRILDLGCGTGRHFALLMEMGFDVYGCDSSGKALEIVGQRFAGARLERCDMTSLPYEEGFFDGVFCNQVVQHGRVADIEKAVHEMFRVLRKGGFLFLATVSVRHHKASTGDEIEPNTRINTDGIDGHMPHHFFTGQEMKRIFGDFEISKLEETERPSELDPGKLSVTWSVLARKP